MPQMAKAQAEGAKADFHTTAIRPFSIWPSKRPM